MTEEMTAMAMQAAAMLEAGEAVEALTQAQLSALAAEFWGE